MGPLTLYYLLMEVAYCDVKTIDSLSLSLAKTKLSTFSNKNTHEHASVWLKILNFLCTYNKVPVNAVTMLLEQYEKCTVIAFKQHFRILMTIQDPKLDSVESILQERQTLERCLKSLGKWNPTKKQPSIFNMKTDEPKHETPKETPKRTHDHAGNPTGCRPPSKGEPHSHMNPISKREEHWCRHQTCGRWGSHERKNHAVWAEKFEAFCKKKQEVDQTKNTPKIENKQSITKAPPSPQAALTMPQNNYFSNATNGTNFNF
jgi:hypothetical protein